MISPKTCMDCSIAFSGPNQSKRCRNCQDTFNREAKAIRWRAKREQYLANAAVARPESTRERMALQRMEERHAREIDVEDKPGKPYRAPSLAAAEAITGVRNVAVNREGCLTGKAAQTCNAHSQGLRVE